MPETVWHWLVLVGSAIAAGCINTIAGGGTLLTFPALLSFGGLSAVSANATSTIALVPGSMAGAWGYRREQAEVRHWLLLLLWPSALGGLVGSLLVTRLPPAYFAALVPWLLLTASLLFLGQPLLARRFPAAKQEAVPPSKRVLALLIGFQFLVAVYGGYFGAGIGVLMISSLALMGISDIHNINAVKTVLAAVINSVSVLVFLFDAPIAWPVVLPMALGAIVGGYYGASVARFLPRWVVRWFVIAVGLALSAYYFARQAA